MRLLHEWRQHFNLLLLNLYSSLIQFAKIKTFRFAYALIIAKNFVPPFYYFWLRRGSSQSNKTYTSQYGIKIK